MDLHSAAIAAAASCQEVENISMHFTATTHTQPLGLSVYVYFSANCDCYTLLQPATASCRAVRLFELFELSPSLLLLFVTCTTKLLLDGQLPTHWQGGRYDSSATALLLLPLLPWNHTAAFAA
jgi:hypothetical protein